MSQRLWRNGQPIDLAPQVWVLLAFLAEHPAQLVTKDQILRSAWPGVTVSDAALSQAVGRLRKVLGDDARQPCYVETIHRRGFRLIAPVVSEVVEVGPRPSTGSALFVGREAEFGHLADLLRAARDGTRQVAFMEGDAGIGKTALLRSFLSRHAGGEIRIVGAQCVEQEGSAEPYMPILEALDRLALSYPETLDVFRRYAPTWLVQMPWLLPAEEARGLASSITGATRTRMLREMTRAVEVVAADRPLVLVLEDLHWADHATVDLLGAIARRPDPARLMVLGTYRPAEAIAYEHPIVPLVRSLWTTSACTRLSLEALGCPDVRAYLSQRLSDPHLAPSLAERIHARTEGNALFLVAMVDHLVERGFFVETDDRWQVARPIEEEDLRSIPKSVREMIELQLSSLEAGELELLQAASVGAVAFRSASIAAALDRLGPDGVESVENACDRLIERRRLLTPAGAHTWPDGTRTERYRFRHDLYRQVLYDGIPGGRRARLHRRIGERLEQAFEGDLMRVAGELGSHFSRSGDYDRAVTYSLLAAEQARRRYAIHEAAIHLDYALRYLEHSPASPDRDFKELQVRMNLLLARTYTQLGEREEEDRNFSRIEALAALPSAGRDVFLVQHALVHIYYLRSLPERAEPIVRRLVQLASPALPGEQMEAWAAVGGIRLMQGRFEEAAQATARALEAFGEGDPPACAGFAGFETKWREAGATLYAQLGTATFFCGSLDAALVQLRRAMELCEQRIRPYWAGGTLSRTAGILCLRGDLASARQVSDRALAIVEENGILHQVRVAGPQRAWLSIMSGEGQNALELIRSGWEDYLASRHLVPAPIGPLFLLDACCAVGATDEGLRMVDDVWRTTRANGMRWYDAELQRLRGELMLLHGDSAAGAAAEECFSQALAIAREQGNRFYELRAATSLARLCRGRRNESAARARLERVYAEFSEGFDVPDLRAAAALLEGRDDTSKKRPRTDDGCAA